MKIRSLLGTCLLLATASVAQALGLGEILVNSRLNQPLNAEIVVREAFPGEAEHLTVRLASAEDFARVGLERSWIPTVLEFETTVDDRGRKIVRITSRDPIREPNLSLLIDANWTGGRLLREYGVLLDPVVSPQPRQLVRPSVPSTPAAPPVEQPAVVPQPAPATPTPAPVAPTPAPATPATATPAPATPAPAPTPAPAAPATQRPPTGFADPAAASRPAPAPSQAPAPTETPASAGRGDGTYTVARGDTLSAIAYELASDMGVNTNQMMLALQRNNASAFFSDNINALKAGAVLRVPELSEVRSLTVTDAGSEVRRQLDSWSGQRSATLADPGAAPTSAAAPAVAAAPAQARVELLSPRSEDGSGSTSAGGTGRQSGGTQVAEVEADLKRAREELTSRDQEVAELTSRVRDLEEMNSQNARLLELKNAEVAALQHRLAGLTEQASSESSASVAAATAPTVAAEPTEAAVEPAAVEPSEPVAPEVAEVDAEVEVVEEEVAVVDPTQAEASADSAAATGQSATDGADADSISEAGMDSSAATELSDQEWEAAATGSDADPFSAEETPSASAPATVTAPPAATTTAASQLAPATPPPAAAQPFYMNPLYQGAALVLLALLLALVLLSRRGRRKDETAEMASGKRSVSDMFAPTAAGTAAVAADSVDAAVDEAEVAELIAHIHTNPDNHDSYVELLSVFYANGDSERFSHWAQRLRQQVSADSAEWQAVADMGRELVPNDPLFLDGSVSELDETVAAWNEAIAHEPEAPLPEPVAEETWRGVDDDVIDLGDQPVETSFQRTEETIQIDEPEEADEGGPSFEPLEFSLDEDNFKPVAAAESPLVVEDGNEDRLPPLDIDAGFGGDASNDASSRRGMDTRGGDDVATKLELARAYLDMGDPDGARAMLEEVLGEGDTAQRDQAARLLDSI